MITFQAKRAGTASVRVERPKALGPGLQDLQPVTAQGAKVQVAAPTDAGAPAPAEPNEGPHA